jgi:hypothetical protein
MTGRGMSRKSLELISVAREILMEIKPAWRGVITGARLKRFGLQRGFPDIQLISPAGLFGLELKRAGEGLTDDQTDFQTWCIAHAVPYSVAYSIDQALTVLDAWGCLRIAIGGAR